MGSSANSRLDASQVFVLVVALLWAIVLLALTPGAKGEIGPRPKVDKGPGGAPYVAGELLVAYEPGTPENAEHAVVRRSGGRTAEDLPGDIRLLSFPSIERRDSKEARERALQRKLEDLRDERGVEAADYNYFRTASFVPNDPKFGAQWGLKKTTFPGAWNRARGAGAKIAIVDSGIDQNHPDTGNISAQKDFVDGDAVANDPYGHGTHVAGIAAALTNNGMGVAGGCPRCGLLIARVLNTSNLTTTDATLTAGINWSANQGADVINLSLGGPVDSSVVKTAVDGASSEGAVVVAAAGNTGTTRRQYPAAYSSVVAVSATNDKDTLASFSSHGSWVDLAAPGTNILSTDAGGGYYPESGTSESAPFVSALAGLLASEDMTASQIRQRMQNTAADLGPAGDDPDFGHGRIDANRAVP